MIDGILDELKQEYERAVYNAYADGRKEVMDNELKEALEVIRFYADINNWHPHVCDTWSGMNTAFAEENDPDNDVEVLDNEFRGGKRAREFLKKLENE